MTSYICYCVKEIKTYFGSSYLIVLLAAVFFLIAKEFLPSKIFPDNKSNNASTLIDSMLIEAVSEKESIVKNINQDTIDNQIISFYESMGVTFPDENFDNYTGNQYLISLYEKLYQLETTSRGNIRIAYYGDSMTDGDYIVQDFRNCFQNKFGGKGVGFIAITNESAASRSTVKHSFSQNWKVQSYLNIKKPWRPFGVSGDVFFADDTLNSTWVQYQGSNAKAYKTLHKPTLFYGSSKNANGSISFQIGKDSITKNLITENVLGAVKLSNNMLRRLQINFKNATSIPIYGINSDDGQGVHIDNFSKRGMSGLPLSKFDVNIMKAFQAKLDYDLIILHYGTNVLNYGTRNYSWYEKGMTRTVRNLNKCFENVPIVIHSTADKATKYNSQMQTDSAVVPLTIAQKRLAINTKSGFVNLYNMMGGQNSMVKWVEDIPALAGKDYTHLNSKGSKIMGELLFKNFMKGYEQYKTLRKNKSDIAPKNEVIALDSTLINNQNNE